MLAGQGVLGWKWKHVLKESHAPGCSDCLLFRGCGILVLSLQKAPRFKKMSGIDSVQFLDASGEAPRYLPTSQCLGIDELELGWRS